MIDIKNQNFLHKKKSTIQLKDGSKHRFKDFHTQKQVRIRFETCTNLINTYFQVKNSPSHLKYVLTEFTKLNLM